MMNDKIRCQSCGMPIGLEYYGTEKNGGVSSEFCKFCYDNGEFREPNLKLDEMIGRSIANMVDDLHMDRQEAETLATSIIPQLKRWVG